MSNASKLYRQTVGMAMGTYCAPPFVDLFLFYYDRYHVFYSENNQSDFN